MGDNGPRLTAAITDLVDALQDAVADQKLMRRKEGTSVSSELGVQGAIEDFVAEIQHAIRDEIDSEIDKARKRERNNK